MIAFAEAEQMMSGVNAVVSETLDDGAIQNATRPI